MILTETPSNGKEVKKSMMNKVFLFKIKHTNEQKKRKYVSQAFKAGMIHIVCHENFAEYIRMNCWEVIEKEVGEKKSCGFFFFYSLSLKSRRNVETIRSRTSKSSSITDYYSAMFIKEFLYVETVI